MSKDLTALTDDIPVTPTQEISLIGGEYKIDYAAVAAVDWSRANYIYVSQFARFYFIKNIRLDIGKQVYLNLQTDPLYTFADQIRNCPATCLRAEMYQSPTMYPDSSLPVLPTQNDPHSTSFAVYPFSVDAEFSYIVGVLSKSGGSN